MSDNVNINVTENIEQVNIVASEVVEVVDLNLYATTEDVSINVTEEIIQVNINKVQASNVTKTSDLINDGEDGINPFITLEDIPNPPTPTLESVLAESNVTNGNDISISDGDEITFDNGSRIRKGLTDSGNGGAKGVALVCSIDYELKWEAGRQYVMQQDGFTIREVSHNFTFLPTATDDDTKGFVIGSRWILDNGDVYECTDATEDNAVWILKIVTKEKRHYWDSPYSYCGTAPAGSLETDAVWTVSEIEVFADGTTSTTTLTNVTWTSIIT